MYVDYGSVAFAGISLGDLKELAKDNELDDPGQWPVYKTTGHPAYRLPDGLKRREKDHPEWELKKLDDYRIAFRTMSDGKRKQRIVFLYREEAKVVFVLYEDIPMKEGNPDSPF